jgi:hypothetical protein
MRTSAVPPSLDRCVETDLTLVQVRLRPANYRCNDTPRPDNGGVSGAAYATCNVFGAQLPGPFTACADANFAATVGSLIGC